MRAKILLLPIAALLTLTTACAFGEAPLNPLTAESRYPGLFSSALKLAIPDSLGEGELLVAGEIKVTQSQLDAEIEKASASLREQFRNNAFFVLEQMAVQQLLVSEARVWAKSQKLDTRGIKDEDLIRKHFVSLTKSVSVSTEEAKKFYESNVDMFGGAKFKQVQAQLKSYLLNDKRQALLKTHMDSLGKRKVIRISDIWAKAQYAKALDNPVEKARLSGKPSLVDFGAVGCRICIMMAPILEELKEEYKGLCNVEFINVYENQVLAQRYGIQSIPVQVFFDKDGREIYRHVGFYSKDDILAKLSEIGVAN
jgi:thiol-disulfide isomerase/thioredoxin